MAKTNSIVNRLVEDFIQKNKEDWTSVLDVGCIGSPYASYVAANIPDFYGVDIRPHIREKEHTCCQRLEGDFRFFPAKPKYSLVLCINTLQYMCLNVKDYIYFTQKILKLCTTGAFITMPFGKGTQENTEVTHLILDAMISNVPNEYIKKLFFDKNGPMSLKQASESHNNLCILQIDKNIV